MMGVQVEGEGCMCLDRWSVGREAKRGCIGGIWISLACEGLVAVDLWVRRAWVECRVDRLAVESKVGEMLELVGSREEKSGRASAREVFVVERIVPLMCFYTGCLDVVSGVLISVIELTETTE